MGNLRPGRSQAAILDFQSDLNGFPVCDMNVPGYSAGRFPWLANWDVKITERSTVRIMEIRKQYLSVCEINMW